MKTCHDVTWRRGQFTSSLCQEEESIESLSLYYYYNWFSEQVLLLCVMYYDDDHKWTNKLSLTAPP